jgi:hypothetical protein
MPGSQTLNPPRGLFERFRPLPPVPRIPGLISALQAYGGLQAWAARAHRPSQSLGRMGSLEVRLAQTAAEVRQAQKLRYRVFYGDGAAIPNPAQLFMRRPAFIRPPSRRRWALIGCCASRSPRNMAASIRRANSTSAR